jgi:hypothetical protein
MTAATSCVRKRPPSAAPVCKRCRALVGQEFLDVSIAQREAEIMRWTVSNYPEDCVTDFLRRPAMAIVTIGLDTAKS